MRNGGAAMRENYFSKILTICMCSILAILMFPITASADTGPKPSVRISFENMGDELCYGTLLSEAESTGPASAWDGGNASYGGDLDWEIWRAFVEYEDTDGYYFLQWGWQVNETKELAWTYYPPSPFKILLYYPETDTFVVSGIYERYAFDSYYTVDMEGIQIGSVEYNEELSNDNRLTARKTYDYTQELVSFVARVVITVLIEMGVALLFGFWGKKQFLFLLGVNVATQLVLNVLLNIINYRSGYLRFAVCYVLLEILVFAIEAVLYCVWMKKLDRRPRKGWFYVVYALVANGASFGAGFLVAQRIPGIF